MVSRTFQEKSKLVKYLLGKRSSILFHKKMMVSEDSGIYLGERKLLDCLNYALDSCCAEHRLILEKDFISNDSKNWWNEYYSKSTYYRLKHRAMDEFLHCLEI